MKTKHYDILKEQLELRTFQNAGVAAREADDLLTAAFADEKLPFGGRSAIDLPILERSVQVSFREGSDIVSVVIARTLYMNGELRDQTYGPTRRPAPCVAECADRYAKTVCPENASAPPAPAPASEWSDTAFQAAEPVVEKGCQVRIVFPDGDAVTFRSSLEKAKELWHVFPRSDIIE